MTTTLGPCGAGEAVRLWHEPEGGLSSFSPSGRIAVLSHGLHNAGRLHDSQTGRTGVQRRGAGCRQELAKDVRQYRALSDSVLIRTADSVWRVGDPKH